MRPSPVILLLAACSSAFRRVKHKASTNATSRCGSCDALDSKMWREAWNPLSTIGGSDTAVGNEDGTCCRVEHRFSLIPDVLDLFSASKMVSSYTILKLVDLGLITLDTKAADVFDWWTATDKRKDVTLRHLLSQTSGAGWYPLGFASCTDGLATGNGTRMCARQAYDNNFRGSFTPGTKFRYTESTFYMASAMAMEVTGHRYWDDLFQHYLARPLGIDRDKCQFSGPTLSMAFAGGGLKCDTASYAKILQAILAKTLYTDRTLYDEAERPHTLEYPPSCTPAFCIPKWGDSRDNEPEQIPETPVLAESNSTSGVTWHYGLGQWTECATPNCEGGILRTSSIGLMGTYPWMDRGGLTGYKPHWGVVVRYFPVNMWGIDKIQEEVIPLAAAIAL